MPIRCAFVFPGQGSQALNMGKDFFENSKRAREIFAQAKEATNIDFEELLFSENDNLSKTEFTQPAILLVSAIAHELFAKQSGIMPTVALGHSLGEFSALSAVGAIDVVDAIALVNLRGRLMAEACAKQEVGMLVALGLDDGTVEAICQSARDAGKQVWAVNYNSDGQIVIAGAKKDLEGLVDTLKEAKAKRAMLLNMSVASHCPLLDSAVAPLSAKLQEVLQDKFTAPIISNVTAKAYTTKIKALELLPKQLVMPVLYKQSIKNIDETVDAYIEFGHGKVLAGLNKASSSKPTFNVSDMASLDATLNAIKEL